ncbi:MAG: type II secretion system protein GspG [Myxococcales bacterium]|nr:type II secretion system protein GspG [Myxococcales bacterium]
MTRARHPTRGYSLLEILIAVAIVAMVSAGIAVAVAKHHSTAQHKTAASEAQVIRSAAQLFRLDSPGECPSVGALIQAEMLDRALRTRDPWGTEYRISCNDRHVTVRSAGPDKKAGTEDDIEVPPEKS